MIGIYLRLFNKRRSATESRCSCTDHQRSMYGWEHYATTLIRHYIQKTEIVPHGGVLRRSASRHLVAGGIPRIIVAHVNLDHEYSPQHSKFVSLTSKGICLRLLAGVPLHMRTIYRAKEWIACVGAKCDQPQASSHDLNTMLWTIHR